MVCHILQVFDQPTSYTVRFADANYNTDNYKMSLVDLAAIFSTNIQYGIAFQELVLPGEFLLVLCRVFSLIHPGVSGIEYLLKDLKVDAGLDNSGFTLHKVLSKLIVKELFAELKLTNIPAWNPFSSPFTLGLTALQVVVQDAYSVADRKVSPLTTMVYSCQPPSRLSRDSEVQLTRRVVPTSIFHSSSLSSLLLNSSACMNCPFFPE